MTQETRDIDSLHLKMKRALEEKPRGAQAIIISKGLEAFNTMSDAEREQIIDLLIKSNS